MTKYKIIWDGEPLETRFSTRAEAERFAAEKYNIIKDEIDEERSNGYFREDYPEYEIEAYETTALEEWKRDLRYSIAPYVVNPYDHIDPPFENPDHPPCLRCATAMNFHGHDDSGDYSYRNGFWKCPKCGFTITEDELKEDD